MNENPTTDIVAWILGFIVLLVVLIKNFRDGTWKWRWDWELAIAVVWLVGRVVILVIVAHFVIKYW